jgi:hypothetical protein
MLYKDQQFIFATKLFYGLFQQTGLLNAGMNL